jgi:hypothetical protein
MFNYIKSLVLGGPKAQVAVNENLAEDDISRILTADDFEEIITTQLDGNVTLYEVSPKALPKGLYQQKKAV